ncbi:MAG: hypothetical protein CO105_07970 [Comamonadaceae bacterium CG_4_9_14_3_um_filter_60_33]|nr:MAG: hypothetical protein COZ09_09555 [Comamonadaceae bacterium CG_4_10_14_3_um_filter_60_42]PJB43788.1 MAG: hypothetical protein CO105_07970 [Comamonadaceae bacterium CG_4_9_14_3_um_filter_60_33]
MAVSVRMEPLLEKELALAAKRRGISKSQFIIEAVERALGRNNPGELYLKVMQEMGDYKVGPDTASQALELTPHKQAFRDKLAAKHAQDQADYAQLLQARSAGGAA